MLNAGERSRKGASWEVFGSLDVCPWRGLWNLRVLPQGHVKKKWSHRSTLKRQGLPFPGTSNILSTVLLPLPALPQPKFSNKVPDNTCVVITTAVFLRISDDPLLKSRKLLSAWKYPCSRSGIAEIPSRRACCPWLEFLPDARSKPKSRMKICFYPNQRNCILLNIVKFRFSCLHGKKQCTFSRRC